MGATTNAFNIEALQGLTLDQARQVARDASYRLRIVQEDGRQFMGTMDYDARRVNIEVIGGKVAKVQGIG